MKYGYAEIAVVVEATRFWDSQKCPWKEFTIVVGDRPSTIIALQSAQCVFCFSCFSHSGDHSAVFSHVYIVSLVARSNRTEQKQPRQRSVSPSIVHHDLHSQFAVQIVGHHQQDSGDTLHPTIDKSTLSTVEPIARKREE